MIAVRVHVINVLDTLDRQHRSKFNIHIGSVYNSKILWQYLKKVTDRNEALPADELPFGNAVPTRMTNMSAALPEN